MTEPPNHGKTKPLLRRRLCVLGTLGTLLFAFAAFMTVRADLFLLVQTQPVPKVDAIVVLGGESWTRPQHAAELFKSGVAPFLLASGGGDCEDTRRLLEARGVPASAIRLEPKSGSTRQNAQFSVPLLREAGARRVIIVTSWYHSRRALACFRKYGRDMTFYSCPTTWERKTWWPHAYTVKCIWKEYAKTAVNLLRDGIVPF
jgi:uncharacterized SAM-binding protein YcdF (DUF218 family)